jgi:hypothetical protein
MMTTIIVVLEDIPWSSLQFSADSDPAIQAHIKTELRHGSH